MNGWKYWKRKLKERMPDKFKDIRPETREKFIRIGWLQLSEKMPLSNAVRRVHMSFEALYKYEDLKSWIEDQVSRWIDLLGDRE